MFGIDAKRRGSLVEERIKLLKQLWSGERVRSTDVWSR